jgi:hypothetical protein
VATGKIVPEGGRKMLLHFRHSGHPGRQEVLRSKTQQAGCLLQRMDAQMPRAQERLRAVFWLLFFGHAKKSDSPKAWNWNARNI